MMGRVERFTESERADLAEALAAFPYLPRWLSVRVGIPALTLMCQSWLRQRNRGDGMSPRRQSP